MRRNRARLKELFGYVAILMGTAFSLQVAFAADVIVGVNVTGVQYLSAQQQDELIEQLRQNGVKVVRTGIGPEFKSFLIHAYQHGIGAVADIDPAAGSKNVRMRHYDLSVGLAWSDAEFSTIDPNAFGVWFSSQVAALESAGVRLTAFELGNEVNLAGDDGDFPTHATGRVLGLADLNNPHDPEGAKLAAGYRIYVKVLAELKRVRDGSALNQATPIIAAGLADDGSPGQRPGAKQDAVSIPDLIEFWKQNGLDNLADGYGIHYYPPNQDPRTPVSQRISSINERAFAKCTSAKPCWLTEWGFPNHDLSCPIHDEVRAELIKTERSAFETFVKQGKLAAIIYYNWKSKSGYEIPSVFRCGALTEAGKAALAPID